MYTKDLILVVPLAVSQKHRLDIEYDFLRVLYQENVLRDIIFQEIYQYVSYVV